MAAGGNHQAKHGANRDTERPQEQRLVLDIVDGTAAHATSLAGHLPGALAHLASSGNAIFISIARSRLAAIGKMPGAVTRLGGERAHAIRSGGQGLLHPLPETRCRLASLTCNAQNGAARCVDAVMEGILGLPHLTLELAIRPDVPWSPGPRKPRPRRATADERILRRSAASATRRIDHACRGRARRRTGPPSSTGDHANHCWRNGPHAVRRTASASRDRHR